MYVWRVRIFSRRLPRSWGWNTGEARRGMIYRGRKIPPFTRVGIHKIPGSASLLLKILMQLANGKVLHCDVDSFTESFIVDFIWSSEIFQLASLLSKMLMQTIKKVEWRCDGIFSTVSFIADFIWKWCLNFCY